MTDIDLFEAETAALARAYKALATNNLPDDGYRPALEELIKYYERLCAKRAA